MNVHSNVTCWLRMQEHQSATAECLHDRIRSVGAVGFARAESAESALWAGFEMVGDWIGLAVHALNALGNYGLPLAT